MNTKTKIDKLWKVFQDAIDAADSNGQNAHNADGHAAVNALHDYTTDRSWRLNALLGRETANERQHRRTSLAPASFSVASAAKLHLMNGAAYGSTKTEMPAATLFLTMRQTAAEAEVIGYLCRVTLSQAWRDELETIDYAKLMQSEEQ